MPQAVFQYLYSSLAEALNFPRPNSIDLVLICMAINFKKIFTCAAVVLLPASECGAPTIPLFVWPLNILVQDSSKPFSLLQFPALCAQLGNAWREDDAAQCRQLQVKYGSNQQGCSPLAEEPQQSLHYPDTFSKILTFSSASLSLRQFVWPPCWPQSCFLRHGF